jgi:hypothetical protein
LNTTTEGDDLKKIMDNYQEEVAAENSLLYKDKTL